MLQIGLTLIFTDVCAHSPPCCRATVQTQYLLYAVFHTHQAPAAEQLSVEPAPVTDVNQEPAETIITLWAATLATVIGAAQAWSRSVGVNFF